MSQDGDQLREHEWNNTRLPTTADLTLVSLFIVMETMNASYEHILYIISKFISDALLMYEVKLELDVNIRVYEFMRTEDVVPV